MYVVFYDFEKKSKLVHDIYMYTTVSGLNIQLFIHESNLTESLLIFVYLINELIRTIFLFI